MLFKQFEQVAQNNPNTAIVDNNISYSYNFILEKINEQSKIFSDISQQSILIYLKKSKEIIEYQLIANKTNNVFTCVDILTPLERINFILKQLDSAWVVSEENQDFTQQGYHLYKKLTKIDSNRNINIWHKENSKIYKKEISHIYFSSGSTGTPKGILLPAQPVVDVTLQQAKIIDMNQNGKFAWLLSPSFDASLSDIYLTLFSGGTLYIADFLQSKIKTLQQFLLFNNITHTDISPSVLSLIGFDQLSCLKHIIFGGEVGNELVIKNIVNQLNINMYNAYGPTETTICSSLKKVDQNWTANNIGKALNGVVYKVESSGELLIGGNHLSLGYVPEDLNKNRFIKIDNELYYKTGDIVEEINNEFFFKGRLDRQFKFNGVLISPEEIEKIAVDSGCFAALCKNIDKYELLYMGEMSPKTLRESLEKKLPLNMMPQKITQVENFETNINGKIKL